MNVNIKYMIDHIYEQLKECVCVCVCVCMPESLIKPTFS